MVRREGDVIMKCMLASRCTAEHITIFLRETGILGMCVGEREEKLTNGRKLQWHIVHGCTCAGPLLRSIFFFYSSILL